MENSIITVHTEKDLFNYIQFIRLSKAKELNDLKIESNKSKDGESFKNFFKKINNKIGKYEEKDTSIDESISRLKSNVPNLMSEEDAKGSLLSLFAEDKNGVTKLLFAIKVALDHEYEYKYEKEGLEAASTFLFNDSLKLKLIKNELENCYKDIAGKSLTNVQKGALAAIIVSSLAISVIVPAAGITGVSQAGTVLAAKGFGDLILGTTSSLIFAAAIVGGSYYAMELHNREAVRKAFKKATLEEQSVYLAIQCMIVKQLRKSLSDREFKEELDSILKSLSTLKSDLDYFLFVEREDVSLNKSKLNAFHEFDKKLTDILF
ncbi:MAG: hypothetical protein MJ227_03780 [Bacilli bacterium]|nr:hypothetical protein [Bacilli bacterium]